MIPRAPLSPPFPYTTLFRSASARWSSSEKSWHGNSGCVTTTCWTPSSKAPSTTAKVSSRARCPVARIRSWRAIARSTWRVSRSEEHTSELQSLRHLVCRLLHDPPRTSLSPLSLHDALPICECPLVLEREVLARKLRVRDDDLLDALLESPVDHGEGVVPREMPRREDQVVAGDRAQHVARLEIGRAHV